MMPAGQANPAPCLDRGPAAALTHAVIASLPALCRSASTSAQGPPKSRCAPACGGGARICCRVGPCLQRAGSSHASHRMCCRAVEVQHPVIHLCIVLRKASRCFGTGRCVCGQGQRVGISLRHASQRATNTCVSHATGTLGRSRSRHAANELRCRRCVGTGTRRMHPQHTYRAGIRRDCRFAECVALHWQPVLVHSNALPGSVRMPSI